VLLATGSVIFAGGVELVTGTTGAFGGSV